MGELEGRSDTKLKPPTSFQAYSCLPSLHQVPQQANRLHRMTTTLLPILLFTLALAFLPSPSQTSPAMEQNFPVPPKRAGYYDYDDYYNMQGYEAYMQKRGGYCIGFGRGCSTKGITCCAENICRCNLFGSNCRCQRSGLFGRR